MTLRLADVLEDPARARRVLQDDLFGVAVARVFEPRYGGVILDLSLTPLPELSVAGYGGERGRVSIRPDGAIYSFPLGPERTWHHRYPSPLGTAFGHLAGTLCLWYPKDPRYLRWEWADGLEQYVTRVYRHLFYEEFYRREGQWPVEDAPHVDLTGRGDLRGALRATQESKSPSCHSDTVGRRISAASACRCPLSPVIRSAGHRAGVDLKAWLRWSLDRRLIGG